MNYRCAQAPGRMPRRGPWPNLEHQEAFPGGADAELSLDEGTKLARPKKVRSAFEVKDVRAEAGEHGGA